MIESNVLGTHHFLKKNYKKGCGLAEVSAFIVSNNNPIIKELEVDEELIQD